MLVSNQKSKYFYTPGFKVISVDDKCVYNSMKIISLIKFLPCLRFYGFLLCHLGNILLYKIQKLYWNLAITFKGMSRKKFNPIITNFDFSRNSLTAIFSSGVIEPLPDRCLCSILVLHFQRNDSHTHLFCDFRIRNRKHF